MVMGQGKDKHVNMALVRSTAISVAMAALGCGTAAGVCGCYPDSCSEAFDCKQAPEPVCPDPATAPAGEDCGVFVSSSLGDDGNPGTRAQPVRTIGQAIAI